ncbi:MAG: YIP1 family protein [Alphaproteobacteria bacterium]|nr:MAG: YIP1 family protein [Alphaproteobacteria bacterium]
MSVVADMLRAHVAPRAVLRRRLGAGEAREDRALAVLMLACGLIFVGGWPTLEREALATGQDFQMLAGGALFGWMFLMPLAAYVLAGVSRLLARMLGGHGTGYTARFSLFWALLVAAPLWLLNGLVLGLAGPGLLARLVGAVALLAFLVHWGINLWTTERE